MRVVAPQAAVVSAVPNPSQSVEADDIDGWSNSKSEFQSFDAHRLSRPRLLETDAGGPVLLDRLHGLATAPGALPNDALAASLRELGGARNLTPLSSTDAPAQPATSARPDRNRYLPIADDVPDPVAEQINRVLAEVAKDPIGKDLLAEARKRGVTVKVGKEDDGTLAHFDPIDNAIHLSTGQGSLSFSPEKQIECIAHELLHSVVSASVKNPGDANSKAQEMAAEVIALGICYRYSRRQVLEGNADPEYLQVMKKKYQARLAEFRELVRGASPSYKRLPETWGIGSELAQWVKRDLVTEPSLRPPPPPKVPRLK